MTKQPRSGEEAHGGGPAPFEGGPVTASRQIGGRRVIGPIAGVDRGSGQTDGQHGLADAGWSDQAARWWRRLRSAASRARLISFLSTEGWALKSKSSSVHGEGRQAKRSRPARRLISVARDFDLEQASQELGVTELLAFGHGRARRATLRRRHRAAGRRDGARIC